MKITENEVAMLAELRSMGKATFEAKVYELACRIIAVAKEVKVELIKEIASYRENREVPGYRAYTFGNTMSAEENEQMRRVNATYGHEGIDSLSLKPMSEGLSMTLQLGFTSDYPVTIYQPTTGNSCRIHRIASEVYHKICGKLTREEEHLVSLLYFTCLLYEDIANYRSAVQTFDGLGLSMSDPKIW